jgi:hypothetical protein
VYNLLNSRAGRTTIDALALVLRNKDIPVINHALDFISTIRAYYVLLVESTAAGVHSRAIEAYAVSLLPHMEELENMLIGHPGLACDNKKSNNFRTHYRLD